MNTTESTLKDDLVLLHTIREAQGKMLSKLYKEKFALLAIIEKQREHLTDVSRNSHDIIAKYHCSKCIERTDAELKLLEGK